MVGAVVKNGIIVNVVSVETVGQLGTRALPPGLWIGDRYDGLKYTELQQAQQEITDKELSIIALGQAVTNLELNGIQQGQETTELELMILGGIGGV